MHIYIESVGYNLFPPLSLVLYFFARTVFFGGICTSLCCDFNNERVYYHMHAYVGTLVHSRTTNIKASFTYYIMTLGYRSWSCEMIGLY